VFGLIKQSLGTLRIASRHRLCDLCQRPSLVVLGDSEGGAFGLIKQSFGALRIASRDHLRHPYQRRRPAPASTYPGPAKARAAVTGLPAALRDPVLDVLIAGNRLAQEAVGQELLTMVDVLSVTAATSSADLCPTNPHT